MNRLQARLLDGSPAGMVVSVPGGLYAAALLRAFHAWRAAAVGGDEMDHLEALRP